ncbi:MAG: hypothetical protein HDT42_06215 [Ruminococcaceae bacterium]|nr:hypothetical protein [Oscillospiraceae bacterium]
MNETRGLWRGKTTPKCNNEGFNSIWVEGDLIHSEELCYIHPFANAVKVQGELGRLIVMHKVDPSTLGECTGLRDKNGKFVFEGDILRTNTGDTNERFCYYAIIWNHAGFYCNCDDTPITALFVSQDEVVGNIHDNPELLKSKNKEDK